MDVLNVSESNINFNNMTESSIEIYIGFFLNLFVVLPENSYVIWLIVTGAGNGVASEFFSLNLSVCEIFYCLRSFLSLFYYTFPSAGHVLAFLTSITFTGRPLFQCLMCIERYLAVIHPVTFLKYKPLRYRVVCCTVAWIMIVITSVFTVAYVLSVYVYICYSLCQALLTLSVKLFCCAAVLRALKQSGPGEREREREKENHTKRRAFNAIVEVTMAILLIYTAYLMAGLVYVLTERFIPELWTAGHFCFLLGGLVQPHLYLHRIGKLPFCKAL